MEVPLPALILRNRINAGFPSPAEDLGTQPIQLKGANLTPSAIVPKADSWIWKLRTQLR